MGTCPIVTPVHVQVRVVRHQHVWTGCRGCVPLPFPGRVPAIHRCLNASDGMRTRRPRQSAQCGFPCAKCSEKSLGDFPKVGSGSFDSIRARSRSCSRRSTGKAATTWAAIGLDRRASGSGQPTSVRHRCHARTGWPVAAAPRWSPGPVCGGCFPDERKLSWGSIAIGERFPSSDNRDRSDRKSRTRGR